MIAFSGEEIYLIQIEIPETNIAASYPRQNTIYVESGYFANDYAIEKGFWPEISNLTSFTLVGMD